MAPDKDLEPRRGGPALVAGAFNRWPWKGPARRGAALALALLLASCLSPVKPSVVLEDPRGDDHGPGGYRYPADRIHAPGAYDLTRVSFAVDGEELIIRVEIRGSFTVAEGGDAARYNATKGLPPSARPADEAEGGLALQNIEIYLDQDGDPRTGEHRALPGRGVSIAGGWERAVWLCPRPLRARTELARRDPALAKRVIVPAALSVRGRALEARLPLSELGGAPSASWGYTVLLSGALSDDIFGGKDGPLFIRPVLPVPDPESFGGDAGPWVIDLWVPPGQRPSQEELLGRGAAIPGRRGDGSLVTAPAPQATSQAAPQAVPPASAPAGPPATQPESRPAEPASGPSEILAEVVERRGDIITLKIPSGALSAGRIGEVVDAAGVFLVVTEVYGEIAVARALRSEGAGAVLPGMKVRFQGSTP